MTPEARAFIIKQFCRPMSAGETATVANQMFEFVRPLKVQDVMTIWEGEREQNIVLRNLEGILGERPFRGYPACEHARLAERLAAV